MPPSQLLRLVLLDSHPEEMEPILAELRCQGYTPAAFHTDNALDFRQRVETTDVDVILADFAWPQYTAQQALELLAQRHSSIPLLLLAGAIGEEAVAACMQQGAAAYVRRDQLAGLGPAVARALRERVRQTQLERAWSEALRAQQVQQALYRISEAAHTLTTLDEVYRVIHAVVGELMPAQNFYIALYDAASRTLTFPYFVDEIETESTPGPHPLRRGLTDYVLRTGQSLLVDRSRFAELVAQGEVELLGADSVDWVGVPLKTQSGILGVLAVQTYTEAVRLTAADEAVLGFVSTQIAMTIERKRTAARLLESEERFRTLAENIPGIIYLRQISGPRAFLFLNDEVERLTGYAKELFLGGHIRPAQLYHPDDAARVEREMAAAEQAGSAFHLSYRILHRSGEVRWVEEWGGAFLVPGQTERLLQGFVSDVTQRHQADEALRAAKIQESLGALAGGVAHDFNNLLVAMLGQTSLALSQITPDNPVHASLAQAVKAAERAAGLTRQLLAFSGQGQFAVGPADLSALVRATLGQVTGSLPGPIRLRTELAEALPLIEADAGQVQQAILNLVLNAVEAIGDGPGTVTVRTAGCAVAVVDDYYSRYTREPLPVGSYVLVEVRDDGSGIEAETLANIFDPFFTTKVTGRGLGLAAVQGIVRGHHGGMRVETAVGQGSSFQLVFPVSTLPQPEVRPPSTSAATPGRVLIIDDEEPVRMAVEDILGIEQVPVLAAENGLVGIEVYRQHQAEIGLVILDLSMPGLSGEETLEALRQINPAVQVVLSSGYSYSDARRRFLNQPLAGFLQKPYDAEALIAEVWKHLQG